jgi:hypothetical protein
MSSSLNPNFVGPAIEVFCPVFFKKLAAGGFVFRELIQRTISSKQLRRGAASLNKAVHRTPTAPVTFDVSI